VFSFKNKFLILFSFALSGSLLCLLFYRVDFNRINSLLKSADIKWLLFAALAVSLTPLTGIFRWNGILKSIREPLPFRLALQALMLACTLNSFLPSKAGDAIKVTYLKNYGGYSHNFGIIILERLADLATLGLLGAASYILGGAVWGLTAGILLGVIIILVLVVIIFFRKVPFLPNRVNKIFLNLSSVFFYWIKKPLGITQTISGSFLNWCLSVFVVYFLTKSLRLDVDLQFVFSIFPLAVLAGLAPFTISGIGTRDSAFVALFSTKIPIEEATLIAIGYTFFSYWYLALIGYFFWMKKIWSTFKAKTSAT
jgi:uncharacterized membrane protein YbhN (UPF0104 family)